MENLSLEAKHLLRLIQDGDGNLDLPTRISKKKFDAVTELKAAGLLDPTLTGFRLSHRGYDPNLTKL